MKILLGFVEVNQRFGALGLQHGLMSISAVLKQHGHEVALAYFSRAHELDEWPARLTEARPQVVGFYVAAEQAEQVGELINAVPRDGTFTIVGGPHATCFPQMLEKIDRLDAVCIGEGELTLLELVEALESGRDPATVEGLWVKREGEIVKTPPRPFIAEIDKLPVEDWDLFDVQQNIDRYGMGQMRVLASRGCPYKCTYCANHILAAAQPGRYVRFRSIDNLLDELKMLKARFTFEEIFFDDDIFMLDRRRLREFAERYPKEVGVPFICCGRVEVTNDETMQLLKQAGARRVDFGVEVGDEELRRTVLKRTMSNDEIIAAIECAQRAGLQVKTLNMVGLPGETPEKHMATVRLNQRLRTDVTNCSVFWPHPGTELYDLCVREGYVPADGHVPERYIAYRTCYLKLPGFPAKVVNRAYRLFCFRVFWRRNKLKALAYWLLYSRLGVALVGMLSRAKKKLRRVFKGM
ncbi:MAG: B12-binding domain-containing radical SAM protein [Verrucomicrobia bacterium]|nr:B12-binding domain-containing radical SAM protein [Verrucomicrobiota bacterium]